MWNFMPSDLDLRTSLIFCYHVKKNAAESHQILVETYGGNAVRSDTDDLKSFKMVISIRRAKPTKDIVKALGWEPLAHAAYSLDLAPSDYRLFASLGHALASLLTKTSNLGLITGCPQKTDHFFGVVFTNCPKDGENM
ncbi:hypothetical protein TNCV_4464581 [Trichonephila clavipes]|nr:hypothetical protein TNCV_4464581 [Trichonephila clavipes]